MDQEPRKGQARTAIGAAVALVAGISLGIPLPAFAAVAQSSVGAATAGGYNYRNYAEIDSGVHYARTFGGPSNFTVPVGWIGARGRIFSSGGALLCEGATQYNSSSFGPGAYWSGNSCTRSASGAYYSYGVTRFWNGGSYNDFYTYTSPTLDW